MAYTAALILIHFGILIEALSNKNTHRFDIINK